MRDLALLVCDPLVYLLICPVCARLGRYLSVLGRTFVMFVYYNDAYAQYSRVVCMLFYIVGLKYSISVSWRLANLLH